MNAQIVLENVGVRLPQRVLFSGVNWTLYDGMRVALAGRNGSGKSTLLRILAGAQEAGEGSRTVVGGRRLRVGFLDQSRLESTLVQLSDKDKDALSPLAYLRADLAHVDEETSEEELDWEIRRTLGGLGFSREGMDRPLSALSGGWLLRVFIGATLLRRPEALLLDEPTNHLDLSSIQWLEEWLAKEYKGSLILVTHDVELQRRVTDSLAVIHGGRFFYRKHENNYLSFRASLGEEKRLLEKNIEGVERKIEENLAFAAKFKAKANTAARAQSKLKAAEVMQEELDELNERLSRIEGHAFTHSFRFRTSSVGGKFPFSLRDVSFRYGADEAPWIIRHASIDIKRGQKVAIIGDNGAGKTTLLNLLAGRLKATSGQLMEGHAPATAYFGQHQLEELMLDSTVLDNLRARASGVSLEAVRAWLGAFGFSSEAEIQKKAKVLSGGEKARLALLRMLLTPVNTVLLDEPTNHLDIETKELLKNAIKSLDGTALIVSHDREFLADVADRILYLSIDHRLTDYPGTLAEFFRKHPEHVRHCEGHAKASRMAPTDDTPAPVKRVPGAETLSYEDRKRVKNQLKALDRKVTSLEAEMESLAQEKQSLATIAETSEQLKRVVELEATIHSKMVEWERASTEAEALRQKYPDVQT